MPAKREGKKRSGPSPQLDGMIRAVKAKDLVKLSRLLQKESGAPRGDLSELSPEKVARQIIRLHHQHISIKSLTLWCEFYWTWAVRDKVRKEISALVKEQALALAHRREIQAGRELVKFVRTHPSAFEVEIFNLASKEKQETGRDQPAPVVVRPSPLPARQTVQAPRSAPMPVESEGKRRLAELAGRIASLNCDAYSSSFPTPPPTSQDETLCRKWKRDESDFEFERCLSARLAERVAERYYRQFSSQVEDLSIGQLERSSDEWKIADLRVDDSLVDVKNSRRSYSSKNSYSETFVQKHKSSRGELVSICGVLSPYLKKDKFDEGFGKNVLILGETDKSALDSLAGYFSDDRLEVSFDSLRGDASDILPPWVFDYCEPFYLKRRESTRDLLEGPLGGLLDRHDRAILEAFAGNRAPLHDLLRETHASLLSVLPQAMDALGLSRPMLFLGILKVGLQPCRPDKETVRRLLFGKSIRLDHPLGIRDPLGTIASLIKVLWQIPPMDLAPYVRIKLSGRQTLRGMFPSSRWNTLFAYCGGRFSDYVSCGYFPLTITDGRICSDCDRLICRKCGFCTAKCPGLDSRGYPASRSPTSRAEHYPVDYGEMSGFGDDDVPF